MKVIKSISVKLIVSILVVLTLANFIGSANLKVNYSFADTATEEERVNSMLEGGQSGILDILINGLKSLILSPFRAARSLNYILASSGGATSGTTPGEITPFDIFFNRFTLLDANIFTTTDRDNNPLDPDSLVYKIRTNTAAWYYGIRTVAIIIMAAMLLWNLFRVLSKSSTPEKKSVAKNAIVDWVLSLALIMFMHIIIILVLNFNDLILGAIEGFTAHGQTAGFFDALENAVFNTNLILGIAALVVYAVLMWQTFKYILVYIQRLLTIVLLIMISPIIPVTYSLDKMKGGKGGALNNWLKELIFNVFVQSLHALVYAALIGIAMDSLTSTNSISATADLGNALVAIAALLFIKYAEKLLKSIFGFDTSQVLNTNVFANAASTISNFSNQVRSRITAPGTSGVQFGQNVNAPGVGGVIPGMPGGAGFGKNIQANAQQGLNGLINGLSSGIKQKGGSLLGGIRNVATGVGADGAIDVTAQEGRAGRDGADGADGGEATAEATAEAFASAEATAEATVKDDDKKGAVIVDGTNVAEKEAKDELDKQQTKDIEDLKENVDTNMSEKDQKMQGLENAIKSVSEKDGTNKKSVTENAEATEFNKLDENINEEQINTQIDDKNGIKLNDENMRKIVEELKDKITPELNKKVEDVLKDDIKPELLEALKDIGEGNPDKLGDMRNDLNGRLSSLMYNGGMDPMETMKMDREIDSKMKNPEALGEYINSLPEGSNEREYAETYAKLSTLTAIDNTSMSNEEKVQALLNTNNAFNMNNKNNSEGEVNSSGASNVGESDNATPAGLHTSGNARTMAAVNGAMENIAPEEYDEIDEVEDDVVRENVSEEDLEEISADLYKVGVNVKGTTVGELETEFTEEYNANFEHFEEQMGRVPQGLDDIYENMNDIAKKQFDNYSAGKIDASKLSGDAKALATMKTLETAASRLGFEMRTSGIQYSINNGATRMSSSTQGVISDLEAYRRKKEEEAKNKRNSA